MSGPTGIPSIDFIIEAVPAAEGMLVAADEPALAALLEAVKDLATMVAKELTSRGFDAASAIKAADAAAEDALALKFRKP